MQAPPENATLAMKICPMRRSFNKKIIDKM
jgi:hypothetical protein